MKKTKFMCAAAVIFAALGLQAEVGKFNSMDSSDGDIAKLRAGFRNPRELQRPWAYWNWISGNVTREGIEKDFAGFKNAGLGGVILMNAGMRTPEGPLSYHSEEWFELVKFSVEKAAECGMSFSIFNCDGWSEAGGPWVTPQISMKKLVFSATQTGGGSVSMRLEKPSEIAEGYYEDVEVFALPRAGAKSADEVLALSSAMDKDGFFRASLPEGEWTLLRVGCTTTGVKNRPSQLTGRGLEVDKLCAQSVRFHLEKALGRVIKDSKGHIGKTFKGVHFDSWEVGTQDWTRDMRGIFKEECGYDPLHFLPVLLGFNVGTQAEAEAEAFKTDYRRAVSAGIEKNFYAQARRFVNENGLQMLAEPYRGHAFNESAVASQVDVVMAEFLDGGEGDIRESFKPQCSKEMEYSKKISCVKKISSYAHMAGKRICSAEAFTARKEDARKFKTPAGLKQSGDAAFVSGMNFVVLHTCVHQPAELKPGFMLAYFGTHFNRANTWWRHASAWTDYLSRAQMLLQCGMPRADVLLLGESDIAAVAPDFSPVLEGYDYEIAHPRQFARAEILKGALRFENGLEFRAIITAPDWKADLRTLEKLRAASLAGIPIFGFAPKAPDNLKDASENFARWKILRDEIFTPQRAYPHMEGLCAMLAAAGVPRDFEFASLSGAPKNPADFCIAANHRRMGGIDIYFLANLNAHAEKFTAKFSAASGSPQIWDAVSGEVFEAAHIENAQGAQLDMSLPPLGSAFVVFGASSVAGRAPLHFSEALQIVPSKWAADFETPFGEKFSREFKTLEAWELSKDDDVKYFSGSAVYSCEFEVPRAPLEKSDAVLISLGEVYEMAHVKINGQDAGVLWTHPYGAEAKKFLKPGKNTLEISVTNTWFNRMVGDERFAQDLEYDLSGPTYNSGKLAEFPAWWGNAGAEKLRPRKTFTTWKIFDGKEDLEKSGLLGPVQLLFGAASEFQKKE